MALDAQRNWTVSMAENLERSLRPCNHDRIDPTPTTTLPGPAEDENDTATTYTPHGNAIHLPDEILLLILSHTHDQPTLAATSLLTHQWHRIATPLLYAHPHLYGSNYIPFLRTLCPSINARVRPSPLSALVKTLDLRNLVHQGSKSTTARLLGRTKGSLEAFLAPQASFAVNCLAPLGKCRELRELDLTLVSESPPLVELLRTTAGLGQLKVLRLPRSSGFGVHYAKSSFPSTLWPPKLEELSLSGGIDAHFLHGVVAFPATLKSLVIQHCPQAKGFAVMHLLRTAVKGLPGLERLTVAHMPRLGGRAVDDVLRVLPQLRGLSVSADYVTAALFDDGKMAYPAGPFGVVGDEEDDFTPRAEALVHHNLRTLELTYSGSPAGVEDKVTPLDLLIAVEEGSLPALRQVRVDQALLWQGGEMREDVEALTDALQEAAKRDWEAGEWIFAEQKARGREEEERWRRCSGVWVF